MITIKQEIWEFDVDNTLIMSNLSEYPKSAPRVVIKTNKGPAVFVINQFNVNMLIRLAKMGYYIRVHSGTGQNWALAVVKALKIKKYVDSCETKPKGKTDDKPPGDGTTYLVWRDPITGEEK